MAPWLKYGRFLRAGFLVLARYSRGSFCGGLRRGRGERNRLSGRRHRARVFRRNSPPRFHHEKRKLVAPTTRFAYTGPRELLMGASFSRTAYTPHLGASGTKKFRPPNRSNRYLQIPPNRQDLQVQIRQVLGLAQDLQIPDTTDPRTSWGRSDRYQIVRVLPQLGRGCAGGRQGTDHPTGRRTHQS